MAEGKKSYAERLKHPEWQKMRLRVLERDGWACRLCFDTTQTLHVHHLTYEWGRDPWEYPMGNFLTFCERCHEDESASRRYEEERLLRELRAAGWPVGCIRELADAAAVSEGRFTLMLVVADVMRDPAIARRVFFEFLRHKWDLPSKRTADERAARRAGMWRAIRPLDPTEPPGYLPPEYEAEAPA